MAVLIWMILGHFVADYALQSDFMAKHKSMHNSLPAVPWYYVMTGHAAVHGLAVGLATGSVGLALLETVFHWFIDSFKCDNVFRIHTDQALHVSCKVLWFIVFLLM